MFLKLSITSMLLLFSTIQLCWANTTYTLAFKSSDKCQPTVEINRGNQFTIEKKKFKITKVSEEIDLVKNIIHTAIIYSSGIIKYHKNTNVDCTYYNSDLLRTAFYNSKIDNIKLANYLSDVPVSKVNDIIYNLKKTSPSKKFTTIGEIDYFDYNPPAYDLRHSINYYIPRSVQNTTEPKRVMILLHGGGASTDTYMSSTFVATSYMNKFIPFAELTKMIIVAPASSLGWSFLTRILVRDVVAMVRADLNVDPDAFYLWGHSMGGMGITRDGHWLIDQFAGIMPTAAGMQESFQSDMNLKTYFNTNFTHINGLLDHFKDFKTRSRAVEKRMNELEEKLGAKSGYKLLFHQGGHNYDMKMVQNEYLFNQFLSPRNLYQNKIYPLLGKLNITTSNGWNPIIEQHPLKDYLWLEAIDITVGEKGFSNGFSADINNNTVSINIDNEDKRIKKLRIYLSSKMVDFAQPISIKLNGEEKYIGSLNPSIEKMIETARHKNDHKFLFENYYDLELY